MIRVYHNGYDWLAETRCNAELVIRIRRDTAQEALQRAWEIWGSQPALIEMRQL